MNIKLVFKLLSYFIVLLFLINSTVFKIKASEIFVDKFDLDHINTDNWSVFNETNTPLQYNGSLNFSNVDLFRAHYVSLKQPISSSNPLVFELDFKFNSLSFGSGIAITDHLPVNRIRDLHPGANDWVIFIWPVSSNTFKVFSVPCIDGNTCLPTDNVVYTTSGAESLSWHHLKITYSDNKYLIQLDNLTPYKTLTTTRSPKYLWFGNPMITGGTTFSTFNIDNVMISELVENSFPYFSQLDPKWKNEEYDTASKWAGIDKFGIGRWGCALTSAAMVLQKNGIKSLDGTEIDPSKLNTWLKSQPDGYVGLGYLNWIALTRYVRLSHEAGHSPTKLEFTRTGVPSFPSIIGLPGHFVVVHGEDGNNWLVNDPANASTTTLPKSTALKSVNTFVPSMTDMSYMLFAADPKLQIELKKEHLKRFAIDWSNESLTEQIDQGTSPETKIGMISKPKSGEYELKVSNPTNDKLNFDIYLYDVNGNPWIKKIAIYKNSSVKFEIKYNRDKVSKSKLEHEKRYRYMRNRLKKIIEKIWDEHDRWEERSEN